MDVFITLQNIGGVDSKFFFKFPDDINIKREIWMESEESTSNGPDEYRVVKEKIFEIKTDQSELKPDRKCNIRIRYNIKEYGEHKLRVIFQIVNGKPIIFELYGQTFSEKDLILEIPNSVIDFHYIPMGYTIPIISPIEIRNIGGVKLKYFLDEKAVKEYNHKNDDFEVFKLDKYNEDSISSGDFKYLIAYFRPLTNKHYCVNIPLYYYYDDINKRKCAQIILQGSGYHPLLTKPPLYSSVYEGMPRSRVHNEFEGEKIQKCGISLEELNFGEVSDKPVSKTFILYNFSKNEPYLFEFKNPGFTMKDDIVFDQPKGKIEPNSHQIIKATLVPKDLNSTAYEGEIEVKIVWSFNESGKILEKEKLFIRVLKKPIIREVKINLTVDQ
jgi:hypothetical protein